MENHLVEKHKRQSFGGDAERPSGVKVPDVENPRPKRRRRGRAPPKKPDHALVMVLGIATAVLMIATIMALSFWIWKLRGAAAPMNVPTSGSEQVERLNTEIAELKRKLEKIGNIDDEILRSEVDLVLTADENLSVDEIETRVKDGFKRQNLDVLEVTVKSAGGLITHRRRLASIEYNVAVVIWNVKTDHDLSEQITKDVSIEGALIALVTVKDPMMENLHSDKPDKKPSRFHQCQRVRTITQLKYHVNTDIVQADDALFQESRRHGVVYYDHDGPEHYFDVGHKATVVDPVERIGEYQTEAHIKVKFDGWPFVRDVPVKYFEPCHFQMLDLKSLTFSAYEVYGKDCALENLKLELEVLGKHISSFGSPKLEKLDKSEMNDKVAKIENLEKYRVEVRAKIRSLEAMPAPA